MSRILFAVALLAAFAGTRALAHHAFAAEYDESKLVTVEGVVAKFEWTNPHAWLYVDAKDEQGSAARWSFEMGSPNGLRRRGWRKEALKAGDRITIDGYRAKDGRSVANARIVTFSDGHTLFGGFQSTPRAPGK
ncbi:MAG TPA: DUF6152 family protein [Bryobacteraceae bacterium]|jgi:hypothetical protein|nr:DUF6152 family protein [Bryobacteraceae bacterium]